MEIQNKVIIVTGASAGIGRATAKLLAQKGAKVALVARRKALLDELSQELPDSFVVVADLSVPAEAERMIDAVQAHYGRIDALINNAGVGIYGAVANVKVEDFKRAFELNVIGATAAIQRVIPIMRAQGGGSILNVSSMVSKAYYPFLGAYAATKYALNAISLTARTELEKENIIVGVMHPGMTDTDFGKNAIKSDIVAQGMESRQRENMPKPDSPEFVAGRILEALQTGAAETYAHETTA